MLLLLTNTGNAQKMGCKFFNSCCSQIFFTAGGFFSPEDVFTQRDAWGMGSRLVSKGAQEVENDVMGMAWTSLCFLLQHVKNQPWWLFLRWTKTTVLVSRADVWRHEIRSKWGRNLCSPDELLATFLRTAFYSPVT